WFDCGDHVLFGQTFFYSAYMLALAYKTFPEGFHDLYHGTNYSDYMASEDWSINGGKPSSVPDLLEELKYATDFIIKATPNTSTFYSQKGSVGSGAHTQWVTSGYQSTLPISSGGESGGTRPITKNPNDGAMPAYAAATLAVMSEIYRPYDSVYADLCLAHAKNAYGYAKPRRSQSTGSSGGGQYDSANRPSTTAFVIGAAEMYMATGDITYRNDISSSDLSTLRSSNHNWGFDYQNTDDLALYVAAMAIPSERDACLNYLRTRYLSFYTGSINSEGLSSKGNDGWGPLRYNGNFAFIAALYADAMGTTSYDQFILNQIDYILGANSGNWSFIVGFDEPRTGSSTTPKQVIHPHHRNVFLNDTNPSNKNNLPIPSRNKYFGYMIGGSRNPGTFKDGVDEYTSSEGGVDYNAGLLGALGYIVSKKAPAAKVQPCGDGNHTPGPAATCGKPQTCTVCSEQLAPATGLHTRRQSNCTQCSVCNATGLGRNCGTENPCDTHKGTTKAEVTAVTGSGSNQSVTITILNNENRAILPGWRVKLTPNSGQIGSTPRAASDPITSSLGINTHTAGTESAGAAAFWFSNRAGSQSTPVYPTTITLRTTTNTGFRIPSGGEVTVTFQLYNSDGVPSSPSGWTAEFTYELDSVPVATTPATTSTPPTTTAVNTTTPNSDMTTTPNSETTTSGNASTTISGAVDTTVSSSNTTISGATDTTPNHSETTISGNANTTVSGAVDTTVSSSNTTISGAIDTTVSESNTTISGGVDTTYSGGDTTISGAIETTTSGGGGTTVSDFGTTSSTNPNTTISGAVNTTISGASETTTTPETAAPAVTTTTAQTGGDCTKGAGKQPCELFDCSVCNPNGNTWKKLGDTNGDGKVDIFDCLEILKSLIKMKSTITHGGDNISIKQAEKAGIISSDGFKNDKPTIFCVLEVLKYMIKMKSIVEGDNIAPKPKG
ncbi:MAG: glycoside hydrolase family 9 protein, partial [Oscillospiraceae bacterium]|nr:glycoside hydrolase family 9 protein [Oscillospiraceae bacterium]